ncbi:hypothetical protein BC939DRAFT_423818, partial [Gamsiella multidivaricata]|uniref:uncharacterized protein n=1 Tax=Gamsiella multidivaricata TaxID=101098 RepID=UPI00221FDF92
MTPTSGLEELEYTPKTNSIKPVGMSGLRIPQSTKAVTKAGGGGTKIRFDVMPTMSSEGKRYADPRQGKKARKAALKTATTLFSNERTFLHWIKFGILLGGLALTLLNFSAENTNEGIDASLANRSGKVGKIVGVVLMGICLMCLVYASSTFHWRHMGVVRSTSDNRYFDRIGPTLLTVALLSAYSVNVLLTIQLTSGMDTNYHPAVFYNTQQDEAPPMAPAVSPVP